MKHILRIFIVLGIILGTIGCKHKSGVVIKKVSMTGIDISIEENLTVGTKLEGSISIQNAPENLQNIIITLTGNGAEDFNVSVTQGTSADIYIGSVTLLHSLEGKGGTDYNLTASTTIDSQTLSVPVNIKILSVGSDNNPPTAVIDGSETEVNLEIWQWQSYSVSADYSQDEDDGIVLCQWLDDDNQVVMEHTFSPSVLELYGECMLDLSSIAAGNYDYTLKVKDKSGAEDTNILHLTVLANAKPTIHIEEGNQSIEANTTLTLHATASDTDSDDTLSYQWMYGLKNGSVMYGAGTATSFEHNFTNIGTYLVTAEVRDNHGASSSDSIEVIVHGHQNQPPIAKIGFKTESGTENEQNITTYVGVSVLRLAAEASIDPDGSIVDCQWRDSDGTLLKQASNVLECNLSPYIFYTAGQYEYTLSVEDNEGATDTNIAHISVGENNIPQAHILDGNRSVDVNTTTHFVATANDDDNESISYFWRYGLIGDANPTVTPMQTYTSNATLDINFTQEANYFVEFWISDAKGANAHDKVEVNASIPLADDIVVDGDLMWEDTEHARSVTLTWQEAYDYCDELTLGGYEDWRLSYSDANSAYAEIFDIRKLPLKNDGTEWDPENDDYDDINGSSRTIIEPFKIVTQDEHIGSWTSGALKNDNGDIWGHIVAFFAYQKENMDGMGDNEEVMVRCVRDNK